MTSRQHAGDAPQRLGLTPRWRAGDSWLVRYRWEIDESRSVANPPPVFADFDWVYRVESIDGDGRVEVSATYLGSKVGDINLWKNRRMFFGPGGDFLALEAEEPMYSVREPANPFFELDSPYSFPVAHEWPRFPLVADSLDKLADGFEQRVERTDHGLRVTLHRHGVDKSPDGDRIIERTMAQVWEEGRPSWSSIVIRFKAHGRGDPVDRLVVEGHVVEWRPAKD